jgi:S-adenosylmethionine synthetase
MPNDNTRKIVTSESVANGHPDKVADQISDAVLDAILEKDPKARVDCETLIMQGTVVVTGQITTNCYVDIPSVIREKLKEIGLDNAKDGLDWSTCGVMVSITEQSPDISQGITETAGHEQGAGDQGIMFGYACDETPELMPMPIMLAHALVKRLETCRKEKILLFLRPDGKSQVTVEYENDKPKRVSAVVVAAQHSEEVDEEMVRKDIEKHVIRATIPPNLIDENTKIIINGTGRFVIGGTLADSGLTGRKTQVDSYGGTGRHGGGCFSGKDPSKVDRSGSYMCRYIAKNIVAANLAKRCEVQVAYAIGVAQPIAFAVETFGTGRFSDEILTDVCKKVFDLRPKAIIEKLHLINPIYAKTAVYGHFGRSEFPWEKIDSAQKLLDALKIK